MKLDKRFWIIFWIFLSLILALFGYFSASYSMLGLGSSIAVSLIGFYVSFKLGNRIVPWLLLSMAFQNFGQMKIVNYSAVIGFFGSFISIILALFALIKYQEQRSDN